MRRLSLFSGIGGVDLAAQARRLADRHDSRKTPQDGIITCVDAANVRSPNPGYCFKQAGFRTAGRTRSGLIVLRLAREAMPEAVPVAPISEVFQLSLFDH